jgi:Rrf2 family nitric oxide-sensitive transcriptional repressor
MRLTLQTDYALRTLVYLAAGNGEWPSVRVIAEAYDISQPHLVKVVQALAREGFVETRPGRKGGVRLARSPDDIHIGDVVRRLEPSLVPVVCLDANADQGCVISPACGLKDPLRSAMEQYLAVLDGYSISDCVTQRAEIQGLLQIGKS